MPVAEPPKRADQDRAARPKSGPSAVSAKAFAELLQLQRIKKVSFAGPVDLPASADLRLNDGRCFKIVAQALPANGRAVSAALRAHVSRGPLDSRHADPAGVGDALSRQTVRRIVITGHPGTTSAYHVLIVADSGDQVAIEAHALPAEAGSPVLQFQVDDGPLPHGRVAEFDAAGDLIV